MVKNGYTLIISVYLFVYCKTYNKITNEVVFWTVIENLII
ncbi:hypothetical protein QQI_1473 [Clostridioides difficile Y401]|nr:hypothetical protein QC7_1715 [Clostridioides difficile CD38]EQE79318.1 hypothetical protein QCQ_1706 [Clostridioides difficile CD49]EQF15603.1 hypothetical protein QEQ_1609 [Clostridioides difficile CD144]EQH72712.1 hypothetical protein QMG_1543 [Clostridioides difficile DA00256]EQI82502.1 hypothetical protein QQI_1473 [Clostridioides difficile Y401]EQL08490.1 hypothetical protein QE3_1799 [Clostridioides difficile CD88]